MGRWGLSVSGDVIRKSMVHDSVVIRDMGPQQAHMECRVHPPSCQLGQELQCYCQGGCMRLDDLVWPNELGQ